MLQALARWLDDARYAGVNILGNMGSEMGVAGLEALLEGKHTQGGDFVNSDRIRVENHSVVNVQNFLPPLLFPCLYFSCTWRVLGDAGEHVPSPRHGGRCLREEVADAEVVPARSPNNHDVRSRHRFLGL
jgi:hypothetical protein